MATLAFSTPVSTPERLSLQRRKRGANDSPPLLKRKRNAPSSCSSATSDIEYLPTFTNLPFLDCENFGNGLEAPSSTAALPLPSVTLHPRTKRSRLGCFVSSSPQDQDEQDARDPEAKRQIHCPATVASNDDEITDVDAELLSPMRRALSSKSMQTRRSSMNLSRSLSLQLNVSLTNLSSAAMNTSDCLAHSASTTTGMPQRRSLLQLRTSSSSDEIQNQEANHRRSPVTTTLDYLATAIRFPDVGIGLSI